MIEQGGSADLSYRASQLETEGRVALGIHTWGAFSLVLQRHCVEVWNTALRNSKKEIQKKTCVGTFSFCNSNSDLSDAATILSDKPSV